MPDDAPELILLPLTLAWTPPDLLVEIPDGNTVDDSLAASTLDENIFAVAPDPLVPDDDATICQLPHGPGTAEQKVGFRLTIPEDAGAFIDSITSVEFAIRLRKQGPGQDPKGFPFIIGPDALGGDVYHRFADSPQLTSTTTYIDVTTGALTTNPITGLAWNPADFDDQRLQFGFGSSSFAPVGPPPPVGSVQCTAITARMIYTAEVLIPWEAVPRATGAWTTSATSTGGWGVIPAATGTWTRQS